MSYYQYERPSITASCRIIQKKMNRRGAKQKSYPQERRQVKKLQRIGTMETNDGRHSSRAFLPRVLVEVPYVESRRIRTV